MFLKPGAAGVVLSERPSQTRQLQGDAIRFKLEILVNYHVIRWFLLSLDMHLILTKLLSISLFFLFYLFNSLAISTNVRF